MLGRLHLGSERADLGSERADIREVLNKEKQSEVSGEKPFGASDLLLTALFITCLTLSKSEQLPLHNQLFLNYIN